MHRLAPVRALSLAASLLAIACVDDAPPATYRDDAPEALHQEAPTDCENPSSLRRLWLRLLQVPDGCPTGTSPGTVTRDAGLGGPGTVVRDPNAGDRDGGPVGGGPREPDPGGPVGPVVGSVTRTLDPQPPPAGPVVRPPTRVLRPEQDTTFPNLGSGVVDVQHYDLDFVWDPFAVSLEARATLTLVTREPAGGVPLDFGLQLDVTEATVSIDGGPEVEAPSAHVLDKLVVSFPSTVAAGTRIVVSLLYRGEPYPVGGGAPIPIGWTVHDEGAVGTVSEPDAAHEWYPCNDHPTDKATYRTRITVPEGYVGVGNGVQQGEPVRNADGTTSFHWLMDQPMAPYLALVAIDDFVGIEQGTTLGVKLRNYLPRGEESLFTTSLAVQPEALTFLSDRLGPYPFREYGAVVIPGPTAALETQGRSIFQGESARDERTVVHEIAHQWMGNSVTLVRWQSDIWWVEGFARYSEWLWLEQTRGREAYDREVSRAREAVGGRRGWALTQAPSGDLFAQAIYDGGALVFHELRAQLGDPAFWAAMRAFCARFQYGNASSDDLLQTFTVVTGRDVVPLVASLLTGAD
ncbi:MAG: M1 family metallopeptidase [Polyangiales bacterium]